VSQIILDDQLFDQEVLIPIARWTTVQRLRDLRPGQVIKDERVPDLLRELNQPTFITIDQGFWNGQLAHSKYCILCFPLKNEQQNELPFLLRRLFRLSEFRTKSARMGKVARVSAASIEYWRVGDKRLRHLEWGA
jgi:hypothetical protein